MATLFISHASEDKDAFVRPLADALKADFSVWYDEYEIHVGDSLRDRIDDGLRRCDYGVVVLSKSFFQKNWTKSELDGLLALEKANRKLILPVWYQVTKDDVTSYSPILAGRLAAAGDKGVDYVVNQLKVAIDASERTREVEPFSHSKHALKALTASLASIEFQKGYFWSPQGVKAVGNAADQIVRSINEQIVEIQKPPAPQRFQAKLHAGNTIQVYGPYKVVLTARFIQHAQNMVEDAFFIGRIYIRGDDYFERDPGEVIEELVFFPKCFSEGAPIMWILEGSKELRDTENVVDSIVGRFCAAITDRKEQEEAERLRSR